MNTKKIDLGRITGLDSYELAVKYGKFSGTREEFMAAEMEVYNQTKDYSDQVLSDMNRRLAALTDNRATDLSEIITARNGKDSLSDRLDETDSKIQELVESVQDVQKQTTVLDSTEINSNGELLLTLRDIEKSENVESEFQIRNTGAQLQWRIAGVTEWKKLIAIRDLIPELKVGKFNVVEDSEASFELENVGANQVLVHMNVPKIDVINGLVAESGYNGIRVKSPNGTQYVITVSNSGKLVVNPAE